ncbi:MULTISPECIES: MFS transporter [Deinococcus]|uniref:MFS transporter n=1 Tax=Deinococcus rufus TaxID=2136097 RepID=A0ABV7ZH72_9DEIO|nr:MFS transporter [Deinococcus sp. AB2017081]WQE96892.1 MFS transporter [Deinococcus sp. AB2017081]
MPRSLWVLALGNFAVGTSGLVLAGILGLLAADLDVPLGTAGTVITAYALTYAVSAVLLSGVTGHLPRRTLLIAGLGLFTLGNVAAAVAPSFGVLLLARAVSAVGASVFTPVASGVAAALVPPELRGRALALVFVGIPVATVLGVPLGTWIGGAFGWRTAFWLVVAVGVLALAGVAALVRPVVTPPAASPWRTLLRRPALVRALLVTGLLYLGQFAVYPYLVSALRGVTGLDAGGITGILLLFGVAGLLGNALGGRLTDVWSGPGTLRSGLILTAASLLALPLVLGHGWSVAVVAFAWGAGSLLVNPPQQSHIVDLAPGAAGVALALNASALYVGQALGAPLGGAFAGNHLTQLGYVGGGVVLLALLVALWPTAARPAQDGKPHPPRSAGAR